MGSRNFEEDGVPQALSLEKPQTEIKIIGTYFKLF